MEYSTPKEYLIRLHHVRPRFKNDIENILVYMASEISKIPAQSKKKFANVVNEAVKRYPGNSGKSMDTINNWRTEISSLFGFIEHDGNTDLCGLRARELSDTGDLVRLFKSFLYTFQYPGAHIRTDKIKTQIINGVKFKPAKHILQILKFGEEKVGCRVWLTKGEACHMIFNDLRVVRDNESIEVTWDRIQKNREDNITYNMKGDTTRYAGDIIDYMIAANLLITYDNKRFYINSLEEEIIQKFIHSTEWFDGYDIMIDKCKNFTSYIPDAVDIKNQYDDWFYYVNRNLSETDFSTDVLAFLSYDHNIDGEKASSDSQKYFMNLLKTGVDITTKEIGDFGESLAFAHERARLQLEGADNVIHLIKRIPSSLALGYDINSREADERHRYIEVKTTISSKSIQLFSFHLTRNEWNSAETNRTQYFVYRLMVSKEKIKLYIISDPVGLYKNDVVRMVPTEGADITFRPETAGIYEEILS